MHEAVNTIFLGCNYNDKSIKALFDKLKQHIEETTPLSCIVVDKRDGKQARDIWRDIKEHIETSAACIFDVTGFRPNVVLELGYALSIKSENQIFVTFRTRKANGQTPQWILSDIGHLQRFEYVGIGQLEEHIRGQLHHIPYYRSFEQFQKKCGETTAPDKYRENGLAILKTIRMDGGQSDQQVRGIMAGSACRFERMMALLKDTGLVVRGRSLHGKFDIP